MGEIHLGTHVIDTAPVHDAIDVFEASLVALGEAAADLRAKAEAFGAPLALSIRVRVAAGEEMHL